MPEFDTVRRVITAQKADGKNVVSIDEQVEPYISDGTNTKAGHSIWRIWGSDGIPQLPLIDGEVTYEDTMFAPAGGYRVQICEFPAESGSTLKPRGQVPGLGTELGRNDTHTVSDELGDINDHVMHFTNSVDIMIVLEGELEFHVEGAEQVTLRKGDVLVNNGVAHAWFNGPVPCRIAMIAQGAERTVS
jgi:mannose-6-phosphate isomerase-like protein (cupin superfamily)